LITKDLQQYRDALVEVLEAQGHLASLSVKEAFAAIPRHLFVSHYYERQPGTPNWTYHEATHTQEWYERVYSDTSFITLIDTVGRTLSSSSQPSIMARMLELLDVQPGQRVLEIGTGTGYNASLLAQLSGNPALVTTVDIEPRVLSQATAAIEQAVGSGMTIHLGSGLHGYPAHAPYHRIIATASTPTVPLAWKEQLAPGGILVCVMQPGISMAGGVLKAMNNVDNLSGRLVYGASFMPLHDEDFQHQPARDRHINLKLPVVATFPFDTRLFDPSVIWTSDFQFFLYSTLPDLHIIEQIGSNKSTCTMLYNEDQPDSHVWFSQEQGHDQVELRGKHSPALWRRLIQLYTLWVNIGQPSIRDYHFAMDQDGQQLYLQKAQGMVWPFIA
jgi:protein-L-isoaspartate(D-aspartate) O-methyltransferase